MYLLSVLIGKIVDFRYFCDIILVSDSGVRAAMMILKQAATKLDFVTAYAIHSPFPKICTYEYSSYWFWWA